MNVILNYRKRIITADDLFHIRSVISEHGNEGRCAVSRRLCQAWDWRQTNGQLKDIVCRGLLLRLERDQLLTLPPRLKVNNNSLRRKRIPAAIEVGKKPITIPVRGLTPIELRQVRRSPEENLYNSLIQQYHYLGYSLPVGEHLKYLAYSGDQLLACMAFSSAPYAIDCRDIYLGWSAEARERNRHLLAYNTRFLILPWVQVPHLASHLLGLIARTISTDWQRVYNHPILWLETFVDTERFVGTCYRAANWIWLGLTSGRGKYNPGKEKLTSVKAMYGYPLTRDCQKRLCHG